jgi:hypothetical protein
MQVKILINFYLKKRTKVEFFSGHCKSSEELKAILEGKNGRIGDA